MAKETLVDQLLLAVATCLDVHRRFTSLSLIGAISGDPRLAKHRTLAQQYLHQRRQRQKIQRAWHHLKRQGYLQEKVLGRSTAYVITLKGQQRRLRLELRTDQSRRRLPDGTWLMVLFDVPESLRKRRDALRIELRMLGFEPLQKSVWVTPWDVQRQLNKVIAMIGLRAYVKPLVVRETSPGMTTESQFLRFSRS